MNGDPLRWIYSCDGQWEFLWKPSLGMELMVNLIERRWSYSRIPSEGGQKNQVFHVAGKAKEKEGIPFGEREEKCFFCELVERR